MFGHLKNRFLPIFTTLIFCTAFVSDDIVQQFNTYNNTLPSEKVYLHLNKSIFTAGETIWFKAYLVDGMSHQKGTLSSTLHVDLIDIHQNHILSSKTFRIEEGVSHGQFDLPDTLPSSAYQVRGYTQWMRNFSQDNFYTANIAIYNLNTSHPEWKITARMIHNQEIDSVQLFLSNAGPDASNTGAKYDLVIGDEKNLPLYQAKINFGEKDAFNYKFRYDAQESGQQLVVTLSNDMCNQQFLVQLDDRPVMGFFPESGSDLVAGLVNVCAFEATDIAGKPIKIHGELMDQDSVKIANINSIHEGRGLLIFNPKIGRHYHVKIKFKDQWYFFDLPEVKSEGILLSAINNYGENLNLTIASKDSSGNFIGPYTLIGQVRGKIYWNETIDLDGEATRFKIPKSVFPSGVLQLTLFNHNEIPLLERLVFINHEDFMNIDITSKKKKYKSREKVTIRLKATDKAGNPVSAKLSATVLDQNQVSSNNYENIVSYFLLSSDVVGPIQCPNQYFKNRETTTLIALDLLMMTRGWRRYKWKDILQPNYPAIHFMPQKGLDLCGTLSQPWNDKPVEDRLVTVMVLGQNPQVLTASTDSVGRFYFTNLNFDDTVNLVFRTASKRGIKQNFNLKLDSSKLPGVQFSPNAFAINSIPIEYINQSQIRNEIEVAYIRDTTTVMLDEIIIEGPKIDADRDRMKMHGEPDYRLKPEIEDVNGYIYVTDYIVALVPGLYVDGYGIEATISSIASLGVSISHGGSPPMIQLDGIEIPPDMINQIPMNMIETIEVIKNHGNVYGRRGNFGIIAIYTKEEGTVEYRTKGITNLKLAGYAVPREFYVPNYSIPKAEHVMPDHRAQLMWAPDFQTDSTGHASFSFFNSDLKTKVKVLVEGIAEDGTPGIGEYVYEIK